MNRINRPNTVLFLALFVLTALFGAAAWGQSVDFTLNDKGLQSLTYNGWQFITDPNYNGTIALWYGGPTFRRSDGTTYQGSGTVIGSGRDSKLQMATILYSWGSVSCTYTKPTSTRLGMHITIRNNTADTLVWDDIATDPFQNSAPIFLVFDTPNANPSTADAGDNTQVLQNIPRWADYPMGTPAVWINLGTTGTMTLTNDSSPYARSKFGRMTQWNTSSRFDTRFWIADDIAPYSTGQYDVSLRFGAPGTTLATMAKETYQRYTGAVPFRAQSPDRRLIGAEFLSSTVPHPSDGKNPRGWFLNDDSVDVTTQAGLAAFQTKMLSRIDSDISFLKSWNCQGIIIWDIEGQEYNHDISYVGDPRMVFSEAPEMAYKGTHTLCIADEVFKKFTDAGLKVGVCLRPTNFLLGGTQQEVTDHNAVLLDKVTYAKNRWGCTLFYCDSTVYRGGNLDAHSLPVEDVFRSALDAYPDVSLMGENQTPRYYGYGGCFDQLTVNTIPTGGSMTPTGVMDIWPGAFTTNYIADANFTTNAAVLLAAVKRGDQLVTRCWFNDASSQSAVSVYNQVGTRPTVSITSPTTNTTYLAPSSVTINATATVSGKTISKVDFYAGGTLVATDTTTPYTCTWTDFTPGNTYCLTAKATDSNGCSTVSDPVKVRIEAPLASGQALWGYSTATGTGDSTARELGTTFHSTVDGRVTNIRVFSLNSETGIHQARIWRNNDNKLVGGPYQFIYGGENGWVTLPLPVPVGIQANVDYTVSVSTGDDRTKLYPSVAGGAVAGNNGANLVWTNGAGVYGTTLGARPTQVSGNTNYFRDVVFEVGEAQYSLFDTASPGASISLAGEYGLKFRSSTPGRITKIRYLKTSGETGTHTGRIWSSTGTPLASAVFTNETDSGWQEVALNTPLLITADTDYTVSVNSVSQYSSATALLGADRFTSTGPLYTYPGNLGTTNSMPGAYPTSVSTTLHYFRDVVFEPIQTLPAVAISGHVVDSTGYPIGGATVTTSYGTSATTDTDGSYTLSTPQGWTGTSSAAATGYVFGPATRSYTTLSSGLTSEDFTALPRPGNVKSLADGASTNCGPAVVTARFGNTFYLEATDRSNAIRVDPTGSVTPPSTGALVQIGGKMATDSATCEKLLQASSLTSLGTGSVDPLGLVSRSILGGIDNLGMLVRVVGAITQIDGAGAWFYIDDGSGLSDGTGNTGLRIVADGRSYTPGGFVIVTGIASCFKGSLGEPERQVKPRSSGDLRLL